MSVGGFLRIIGESIYWLLHFSKPCTTSMGRVGIVFNERPKGFPHNCCWVHAGPLLAKAEQSAVKIIVFCCWSGM